MLDLNIQDLRKKAKIKFSGAPEGHIFTVHRLGAGSELELSKLSRKANSLILKLEKNPTEKQLESIFSEMEKLDEERLRIKASIFDDGGNGSLSIKLVEELTDEELKNIVTMVENGVSTQEEIVDGETA